jgi:hypothetical protein
VVVQPGNEVNNADLKTCEISIVMWRLLDGLLSVQCDSMYFGGCLAKLQRNHLPPFSTHRQSD